MSKLELKPMERESSTLSASAYDPETKVMRIRFKNGGMYDYQNIDPDIYKGVCEEGGSYFARVVKKYPNSYPYTKV